MQLAHAGRKGSTASPFETRPVLVTPAEGGWQPFAPSAIAFAPDYAVPAELDLSGIQAVVEGFRQAARRALEAGFDFVEIHSAHGYLLHEFLSPLANHRTDAYGGSFDNRIRLVLEVVDAVRSEWPERLPLFVRISATDWAEGGWNIDESVQLAQRSARTRRRSGGCFFGRNSFPTRRFLPLPVFRLNLPQEFAARQELPRPRLDSSPSRLRPTPSSRRARPISYFWLAPCCAIPTGRCTQRPHWANRRAGPNSICAPRRRAHPHVPRRRLANRLAKPAC